MTDQQPDHHGSQTSGLGWPLVVMVVAVLAAVTIISVTGGDTKGLNDTLGLLLGGVGAAGGIGAWIRSSQAARQTNGVMDDRMADAVSAGITQALEQARAEAAGKTRASP